MNKNKWFLNGGRGSGRTIRLLCETYENKIAKLQHTIDTLQGYLDKDIEYDMDKTIQEQKIKIAELEARIEEMKCCGNCAKNGHICVAEEMQGKLCGKNKDKWELRR